MKAKMMAAIMMMAMIGTTAMAQEQGGRREQGKDQRQEVRMDRKDMKKDMRFDGRKDARFEGRKDMPGDRRFDKKFDKRFDRRMEGKKMMCKECLHGQHKHMHRHDGKVIVIRVG